MMKKTLPLIIILVFQNLVFSQSFRGLATLNDSQYYVSGSSGNIWAFKGTNSLPIKASKIPNRDYRDIHAWDINTAIAMSVADSGILIKTSDGGESWKTVFQESSPGVFFDVIEFSSDGKLGILMGDPIQSDSNHLYFRLTIDSGNHWLEFENGNWNRISPKLSSLFAASGSSLRIINLELRNDTMGQEAVINATLLIGGGGPEGASLRWVKVHWNLYGELLDTKFFDFPISLPHDIGWGIYGISSIQNDVVLLGGGHWEYPNGLFSKDTTFYPGVWICKSKSKFLEVTNNDITLEPIPAIRAYISGIDLKQNGDYVCVGSLGKYQGNIYRNLYDVSFSPLVPGFKGYNAVSYKGSKPMVIGNGSKVSVLKF